MTFKNKMTIYSFTIRHSFPNLLYVTYLHDVLYVCATSILFLFSQRDHNENKVYPDLYYAIPATVSLYARCCSHYDDFRYRHKCLVDRLLSQGYKALRLEKSFKKFYGRYQDLIEKYRRSVNAMVSDSFPGQFLFNM